MKLKDVWNSWPIGTHFVLERRVPMIKINEENVIWYWGDRGENEVFGPGPTNDIHNHNNPADDLSKEEVVCVIFSKEFAPFNGKCSCNYYYKLLNLEYKGCGKE